MSVKLYKISSFALLNYPHSELSKTLHLTVCSENNLPDAIKDFSCNFVNLAETSQKQSRWADWKTCMSACCSVYSHTGPMTDTWFPWLLEIPPVWMWAVQVPGSSG